MTGRRAGRVLAGWAIASGAFTAVVLGGVGQGSAQAPQERPATVEWGPHYPNPTLEQDCPSPRLELFEDGSAIVWSADLRICAKLPDETFPAARWANLDYYGSNAVGGPNVFIREDGGLVANCDAATVWCDDEGS